MAPDDLRVAPLEAEVLIAPAAVRSMTQRTSRAVGFQAFSRRLDFRLSCAQSASGIVSKGEGVDLGSHPDSEMVLTQLAPLC